MTILGRHTLKFLLAPMVHWPEVMVTYDALDKVIFSADAIEDAFKYGKLVLAASSYDGGLFPPMYDFIHHLQIKGWQKREVALIENGSWAPSAARVMKQMLEEMKDINVKGETVTLRGVMKESDIPALEALADAILS